MQKITATYAKTAKPGWYRADDTLYLYVKPSGRKYWVQRIVIDGARRSISIGPYPLVSMHAAKAKAMENRLKVMDGRTDQLARRLARVPTFNEAMRQTYETRLPTWKTDQTPKAFQGTLNRYAIPKIGKKPVDRITQFDVIGIVKPLWTTKPDQAQRARSYIRMVLDYACAQGWIQTNVAGAVINAALLTSNKKPTGNFRAMPYTEIPAAVRTIENGVTSISTKLCLLFTIHTGTRGKESRGAPWSEIDLDGRVWTVPEGRIKNEKTHRIPLNDPAMAILERAKALRNKSDLLFPSTHKINAPMTSATLIKALKKVDLHSKTVVHGFRVSFRTWAGEETDIPWEVCETALSHTVGNSTVQAYARGDLFKKRIKLMQLWSVFVNS